MPSDFLFVHVLPSEYVIDTNVLIQSPYAIESFEDNDLVIPLVVVEELDGLKKADGEKGANARAAKRYLENLRQSGDLLEGVRLSGGGTCYDIFNCSEIVRYCIHYRKFLILQSRAETENKDMSAREKGNGVFSVSHLQNKNCKTDNCFAVFYNV